MDDEEQHNERFDVDNDFEGGEWIGGEFFYRNKRQKRQQTEEDRIYGVFAENSSDEEGGRRGRRGDGTKADLTKPVAFVSKGVSQPQEEEEGRAGLGGVGAAGAGLGFAPPMSAQQEQEEDDEVELNVPSAFGQSMKRAVQERRAQSNQLSKQARDQKKAAMGGQGGDIGTFERHTRGIASKMMAKMGYVPGQGLGKQKQGISRPIDNKLRPKNMGLGFGDFKEHKMVKGDEKADTDNAPTPGAPKPDAGLWKKKKAPQRQQRVYLTAEALLDAQGSAAPPSATIIDMRGPQARVVSNMEHLDVVEEAQGAAVPMPELQHNLRLLVDLSEADIQRLDGKIRQEKDTIALLQREQEALEQRAAQEQAALQGAQSLLHDVERCLGEGLPMEELEATFSRMRAQHPQEYVLHRIPLVALACVLPHAAALMGGWDPLADHTRGAAVLRRWRRLLQGPPGGPLSAEDDPMVQLVAEVVVPPLRSAVVNRWEPRDPGPLEAFIEAWHDVLPDVSLSYILHHLIMPRLSTAIASWDPTVDTVALHVWLHPWLPYLQSAMSELWPPIRHKFAAALEQWQPWDGSALAILSPWHRVFDAKDWDALLGRSIVPRLALALQQLVINPAAQDMAPWEWVMAWANVMPPRLMVALLESHFFPQWHAVLRHWLSNAPSFDEVTRWLNSWQAAFPGDVGDQQRIRVQFAAARDALARCMAGQPLPPMPQPAAPVAEAVPRKTPPRSMAAAAVDTSMRALVEQFAIDNNVTLVPKVYSFGHVSIVMDNANSSLLAQRGSSWVPVSLEGLLREVEQRAA